MTLHDEVPRDRRTDDEEEEEAVPLAENPLLPKKEKEEEEEEEEVVGRKLSKMEGGEGEQEEAEAPREPLMTKGSKTRARARRRGVVELQGGEALERDRGGSGEEDQAEQWEDPEDTLPDIPTPPGGGAGGRSVSTVSRPSLSGLFSPSSGGGRSVSTVSRPSLTGLISSGRGGRSVSTVSRPSLAGLFLPSRGSMTSSWPSLSSRPSMASLRSGISRANSEFYPERDSTVARSLARTVAPHPRLARKLYIVTQVLAAISVSMGSMGVGFSAAYTSPALASMEAPGSTLPVTPEEKSWIGSLMPLSALTASLLGGYLIDRLGRKMLLLVCGPPFIVAWILIGSAISVLMVYVGRAIGGACVGLLSLTLPVYLGETIQPEIRGTLGLLPTTIGNGGILFCFLLGTYVDWWQLAYAGIAIPVIFVAMMLFVPETPRWYVSKERYDEAQQALRWLRGSAWDVEEELYAIRANFEACAAEEGQPSVRELLRREYLKPLGLSLGLMLFQQLSGINAVIFYTVSIFKLAGSSLNEHLCTIIVGVVNLLSTLVANGLIDRLGRKILLYTSSILMVLSLAALSGFFFVKFLAAEATKVAAAGVLPSLLNATLNGSLGAGGAPTKEIPTAVLLNLTLNGSLGPDAVPTTEDQELALWLYNLVLDLGWLPLVSFMIYVVAFSLGWGPIPWLFMGEALPARIRGPSASLVTALNWSCTFVVTKTFPGMVEQLGPHGVFFLYTCVMVASFFFTLLLVPETKGRTLEEIEAEMAGRDDRKSSSGIYIY